MNLTQSLIVALASFVATLCCAVACKFDIEKEPQRDENGKPIPTDKSDHPIFRVFDEFNPLGVGIFFSVLASYGLSSEDLIADRPSTFEFIIEAIVFDVIEILMFVVVFYIAYGIMSAAKVNGNDEKARRNSAGWVTVVLSFILIFITANQ